MKKLIVLFFLIPLLPLPAAVTNPIAFPTYDPFTSAVSSGGSAYANNSTLGGQTNALGSYWYLIDSSGPAANSLTNTGVALNYSNAPGFSGNAIQLTNAAGPGARMFVWTNVSYSSGGSGGFFQTGPMSIFYSFVLQAPNINNLSASGSYICGFGDQSVIATQTSQPGTVAARLYLKSVSGGYQVGVAKMGTVTYDTATVFATNQALFIVVDYEIQTADGNGATSISGNGDKVRLWVNPLTNTFGAPAQPAETIDGTSTDANLTAFTSCFQFYDMANTPNVTYVTDFRMGTNWSWVTGGPGIGRQPVAVTNTSSGALNLNVTALNNGTSNSYNWQFNGTNLADGPSVSGSGATVSGSQTASLTLSNMDTSPAQLDSGSYTVVISNIWGSITSSVSAVTASPAPAIITQPSSTNLLLYPGDGATLSLIAGGASLSYFWYSNNVIVPGANSSSFVIANAQAGATYYGVVSNSSGVVTSSIVTLALIPPPTAPFPSTVLNDHPIGYWPLTETPDNGSGNNGATAYDSVGGNNGIYSNVFLGQPGYAQGIASQYGYTPAVDTNSSTQFGTFSTQNSYAGQIQNINFAAASNATSFSVEAWAVGTESPQTSGACIVGKGYGNGGEQFTMDYTTAWRFYIRQSNGTTIAALTTNTIDSNWHYLAGVVDTAHSNVTLYVDGVARTTTAYNPATGLLSTALPMTIGARQSGFGTAFDDNFKGNIQNVAVYNYALTSSEISNHYNVTGIGPSIAGLPVQVNLNEGETLQIAAAVAGTPPLSFQWFDATTSTALSGQTNATLVISNISAAAYNNHAFNLVASNIYNNASSGYVVIFIASGPPNSVAIAPSSISVYASIATTFSVTAQGTAPISYQWTTNSGNVSGATNSSFTIALPVGAYAIGCTASNAYGPVTATASLSVVAAPTDAYGTAILNAAPIAYWRLDEPNGASIANDYAGGHNATYNNAINGQPGLNPILFPADTATVFGTNGTASSYAPETDNTGAGIPFIDFSTQGNNAEFSVELWVQEPLETMDPICKGYPNNTQFALDGGGGGNSFRFVIHNRADVIIAANGTAGPDGKWHHLVGVCDEANGQIALYVDGALQGTGTVSTGSGLLSLPNSTYPVIIGSQEGQNGSSYPNTTNASICQVALYAYPLTASQVSAHYAAGGGVVSLTPFNITSVSDVGGTNLTLNWQSVANHTYQVQVASTLAGGTNAWQNLGASITASATNTSYSDTSAKASGSAGFYRVVGK